MLPGNNWGRDEEGTGLGFGPQEEFRACSDVRITPDVSVTQPSPPPMPSSTTTTTTTNTAATATTTTTVPTTTKALTCKPKKAYKSTPGMKQWCKTNCPGAYCDYSICKCKWVQMNIPLRIPKCIIIILTKMPGAVYWNNPKSFEVMSW